MAQRIKNIRFNDSITSSDPANLKRVAGLDATVNDEITTKGQMESYLTSIIGGAGGGAGVEVLENRAHIDTLDTESNKIKLSTKNYLIENNQFDLNMNVTLAKDYSTADTTAIKLDHNAEQIDAMDATTGWAATSGGTVSLDTTNKIEGTGSVKIVFTISGQTGILKTFPSFSVVDKKVRFRVKLDTLTNVTAVRLYCGTTASDYKYLDIAVGDLVADWNFLEWNVDDAIEAGTFRPEAVTRLLVNFITSSSQTINMNVDDIITVPSWGMPSPMQIQIYDTSNEQLISVASGSKGVYTLSSTLANNYLRTAAVMDMRNVDIDTTNYEATFKTGLSGSVALGSWDIQRKFLPDSISNKKMNWSQRFNEDYYQTASFPTTGSIKLTSSVDRSGDFKDNDYIWLYAIRNAGPSWHSPDENTDLGMNAIRLQLNADATHSAGEITLAHDGDNSHGSDTAITWFVVRESAHFGYFVGSLTAAEDITIAIPDYLIPDHGNFFWIAGAEDSLTGQKLVVATKLTRNDTTLQDPTLLERNALIL